MTEPPILEAAAPRPLAARWRLAIVAVTVAGLIPFVGLMLCSWMDWGDPSLVMAARLTYAALIISFMSGTHWGLAISNFQLSPTGAAAVAAASTVPSLLAWAAILLLPWWGAPDWLSFLMLAALLGGQLAFDRVIRERFGMAPWYFTLRLWVTAVAGGTVLLAVAGL